MKLYDQMIDKQLKEALKNQTRIIHIGRKDRLSKALREKIINAEDKTSSFNKYYMVIALDYGGRDEIIRAVQKISNIQLAMTNLNEADLNAFFDTKDLPQPEPDLIIRTSGEKRWSGFMMWQSAYSEYMFIETYFPDFTPQDLEKCIEQFKRRNRRFGK
jgi:undecaprenyl diphosphate synthase